MQQLTKAQKKKLKHTLIKEFIKSKYPKNNEVVDVKTKYGTEHSCKYLLGKYKCLNQPYSFGKYKILEWTSQKVNENKKKKNTLKKKDNGEVINA